MPRPLPDLVWESIVLAYDCTIWLGIYAEWRASGKSPEDYLAGASSDDRLSGAKGINFEVACPVRVLVPMPFMFEQALVCLLQNALNVLIDPDFPPDLSTTIKISYEAGEIAVSNQGPPLDPRLCDAINKSSNPEEFEARITNLLEDDDRPKKPGFGLVEAYCIATQCYGGLAARYDKPTFFLRLHHRREV